MRNSEVRIIEPQTEITQKDVDITNSEAEALLYKYSPEKFKEQEIQKRQSVQPKRFDADADYKPSGEYYDVKYSSLKLDNEDIQTELNFKIEIKSDMPL